jgi:rRNA maturation protein Nop10
MNAEHLAGMTKTQLISLVLDLQGQMARLKAEHKRQEEAPLRLSESDCSSDLESLLSDKLLDTGASRVLECRLERCPDCGHTLQEQTQRLVDNHQLVEMWPIEVVVLRLNRYGVQCSHCGTYTVADYPPGMDGKRPYGSRLESLMSMLKETLPQGEGFNAPSPLGYPSGQVSKKVG